MSSGSTQRYSILSMAAFSVNFFGFAVFLFFGFRASAAPAFLTFTPQSVSGTVLYWTPSSGRWLHVREGVPIPEKTLVQVGEASQLILRIDSQNGFPDRPGKSLEADINTPMVFRLERDLIRSAKINRQVFKNYKLDSESNAVVSSVFGKIMNANFREAFADIPGKGKNRIKVNLPARDNHIHLNELPAMLPVSWEIMNKDADPEVQILMWPEGEDRGPPVSITKDSVQTIPVFRPGAWLLQVASLDWKSKSGVRRFYVHARDATRQNQIILTSPPEDFIYAGAHFPIRIPVSWEFSKQGQLGLREFEVVVKQGGNGQRKETVHRVSGSQSTVLDFLKPGEFTWYVREVAQLERGMDESSEKQILGTSKKSNITVTTTSDYLKSMHEFGLSGALSRQIKSDRSATIFFEQLPLGKT